MILQVMQQGFVADSREETFAPAVKAGATSTDPKIREVIEQQEVDVADIAAAAEWIESIGSHVMPDAHRDATYLPGDRDASLLQSAMQRFFFDRGYVEAPQGSGAGPVAAPISDVELKPAFAQTAAKLFGAMSQTDIGWAACLFAKAYRMIGKRHPFPDQAAEPHTIADNARVYLIGDWGSGVDRAKKVSDRIRTMIEAEKTRPQHVIHLGDVYYSGWPEEYDAHLFKNWPVRPGEEHKYGSWCLNANHDMFSGGQGYFDYLLKDTRFAGQQRKSYFSLETSKWQILGLDSAWTDGDLAGSQLEWVASRQKRHPDKKIILMTHHQPFSAFGEKSHPGLQAVLAKCKITAWYWGHEHRFALYDKRPDLQYPRLLGHSGVPVWKNAPWKFWTSAKPKDVALVGSRAFQSGVESFLLFGFAVLDFNTDTINVRYIYENGEEEDPETLR